MTAKRQDPAEHQGYLRFFYQDWRPTRLGRIWSRFMAWMAGLGLTPEILVTLQVGTHDPGRLSSVVLAAVDYQGQRYLISMLGNVSEWVQTIRATDGNAIIKRGRSRQVKLVEIPVGERAPILKAWCQVATSGRKHLPVPYDAPIADFALVAADYPVFRIDPAPS